MIGNARTIIIICYLFNQFGNRLDAASVLLAKLIGLRSKSQGMFYLRCVVWWKIKMMNVRQPRKMKESSSSRYQTGNGTLRQVKLLYLNAM